MSLTSHAKQAMRCSHRVFQFRESPALYMLRGDVSKQLYLEPIDYRASFRLLVD